MPEILKSDLPFGSEFSPSQISLREVIGFAKQHGGNWKAFENEVYQKYFKRNSTSETNRRKLANNTKLGMFAYGIIDRDANLTELGKKLLDCPDDATLYQTLARHILLNLHGMNFVQCILDMHAAGETIDLIALRERLEERGIHFPRGGKHPSMMRLWLEKAGVFSTGYRVNETVLQKLSGASADEFNALAMLTKEQQTFLKTLANLPAGEYQSNEIEKLASATFGVKFNEKNLPKQVLYPLSEAGYITLTRGTKDGGRGAKPFTIKATAKFVADIIAPLISQLEKQITPELRPFLRKPLPEIVKEMQSKNKNVKGLALEAFCINLMRLLDLHYVATRLRGMATGGAEVDVIFDSSRLVFSRWQVQCKNTSNVSLDDVAKEVGLTHFLKSNVIVVVTTGQVGGEARKYANKIMTDSNLAIVLIDGGDIKSIIASPCSIVDVFGREAKHAMKLKAIDL
jgi:site-specific DNA-methyltransferase (cytosine-N4-specific)